ncbi:MAG TPA: lysophospholipid acyltransferase family protein [Gaiellaceae bacterium]
MSSQAAWRYGRPTIGGATRLLARPVAFGRERVPATGGLVYAINHLHWIDIPVVGVVSPRNVDFVAKVEAMKYPGVGDFIRLFGTIAVRRGESDRDAVRLMRQAARDGRVVGLFVEGTRQKSGRPGKAQPGAAMVALQEDVPVVPVAIYGTQLWRIGNFKPCSVAFGEPVSFPGLPRNGRGYKEATAEIERRLNVLFDWLADVHLRGREPGLLPPL